MTKEFSLNDYVDVQDEDNQWYVGKILDDDSLLRVRVDGKSSKDDIVTTLF